MNTYYLVPAADYDAMFSKAPKDFDAITSGVVNNPTLDEYAKAAALRDSLNTFLNMSQQNKVPIAIPVISHTTALKRANAICWKIFPSTGHPQMFLLRKFEKP